MDFGPQYFIILNSSTETSNVVWLIGSFSKCIEEEVIFSYGKNFLNLYFISLPVILSASIFVSVFIERPLQSWLPPLIPALYLIKRTPDVHVCPFFYFLRIRGSNNQVEGSPRLCGRGKKTSNSSCTGIFLIGLCRSLDVRTFLVPFSIQVLSFPEISHAAQK